MSLLGHARTRFVEDQRRMRALAPLAAACALAAACSVAPPTSPPSESPTPTAAAFRPLPADVRVEPRPGDESARVTPTSPVGAVLGRPYEFSLGHCGLMSPVDFNGALWRAIGAQDESGRPLNEEQRGDLINAARGTITLVRPDLAVFVSESRTVIALARHAGAKEYLLCR